MKPNIFQVIPNKDYTVYVFFDDGIIKQYDVKPLIERGGIFNKLKELDFFLSRCTIMNGTLAWDVTGDRDVTMCIDICPDKIYEIGITVKNVETA